MYENLLDMDRIELIKELGSIFEKMKNENPERFYRFVNLVKEEGRKKEKKENK
ncbi:TPA: hypothetical protein ACSVPQ_004218 [Clostridioides difficile]|uniref:hypothetical protein n=1 Tax=Clostridioides TaxID=1870884 RepID=UPI00038C863C|nr:hypothetical protein [Clostridioides difficile]MCC0652607.1 hypothetical protein [Clostridioides sp. ES-S-0001-03]EII6781490.1 hypothetical protein [Clostridioides difficile]EKS6795495.1 hypothetical protein [Clostridioides difficile]ELX4546436.1 hypothetical protein [Clostridioides difficile]EQG59717.1 hypothetical protein QK3_1041 [Clostridioides difficile DA00145]